MIVAGRLVLDDAVVPGRVVVEGGRIAAIEADDREATGPFVAPGYIDVHVHGWGGFDAMGSTAGLDGMARALVRRGVTSFLPTAVSAPIDVLAAFAARVTAWKDAAPTDGARPLGFNLEGPFLAPGRRGAHDAAHLRAPADVPDSQLAALGADLRVMTIAPELHGAPDLIWRLSARGVVASLGHSDADAAQARAGYAAGATSTTHLFNAMTGLGHRAPGMAAAALTTDAAYVELIADGAHVDAALWPIVYRAKPPGRVVLVSDAIAIGGTDRTRTSLGGLAVEVRDRQARLVEGRALAGSLTALDGAVANVARAGVPLPAAVASASANPAAMIAVADRGRIAAGLLAHLVELDDDLRVRRVTLGDGWLEAWSAPA